MYHGIHIIYSDNGTGHEDLILEIKSINLRVVADTYYFRILDDFEPITAEDLRIKHALALLLGYWMSRVDSLNVTDYCYLPFDFSDEYTGCLKVAIVQENSLRVSYGYSLVVEGWNVDPLDPDDYTERVNDFQATSEEFDIQSNAFVSMIMKIHDEFISSANGER